MTALDCRGRKLDLSRVAVMGVLNITPDSFSDGGIFFDPAKAHGSETEKLAIFREVRDQIRQTFQAYAAGRRDQFKTAG